MSQVVEARAASEVPGLVEEVRGLVRWVCTSNPFYAVSAPLVLTGLWVSFGAQVTLEQTGALMAGLAGYTLLLAVTACLLVRLCGAWQDVRTVLLLVVLMFLATSATFDELFSPDPRTGLARHPMLGVGAFLGGLAFAVAVSEGVLRGLPLRLPIGYRGPYYLVLGLFFVYPLALTPTLDDPDGEALTWALFGFSPAAGLASLTLLPAIRRGASYVRGDGAPWPWPLYPWSLFAFLGFGVVAREYQICQSLHQVEAHVPELHIFGPYFLVPFGLAVAVLALEAALVARRGFAWALLAPAGLVVLTVVGHRHDPVYQEFLDRFIARLGGTPLYLGLLATGGFYAYAALRRTPMASVALTATLAAMVVVGPGSLDLGELVAPRPWPLLAIAAVQLVPGLLRRETLRCLVGAGCLTAAVTIGLGGTGAGVPRGPVAFHLGWVALLAVGAAFDDGVGRFVRNLAVAAGLLAALVVATGLAGRPGGVPPWAWAAYPPLIAALLAGYGGMLGHRPSLGAAGLIFAGWMGAAGWRGYEALRQHVAGLDHIALGLAFFALATIISMAKAGVLSRRGKVSHSSG